MIRGGCSEDNLQDDKFAQLMIDEQIIKCYQSNCKWEGKVSEYSMQHELKCAHKEVDKVSDQEESKQDFEVSKDK